MNAPEDTMDRLERILLVEDDPNDVELTRHALAALNLADDMVVAHDGVEALDYIHRRGGFADRRPGHPVVILLDLKMPRVNGLEVLRELRSDPSTRMIPIVALTSSRTDPDLAACYRLGVNAYVVKPVRFAEFTEAVKRLGVFWVLINQPPPGSSETPPGSAETPSGSAETPPGSAETPPGSAETPPGSAETPPGSAETPSGEAGAPS
jgi:CheY-like chemotaxis protein